MKIDRKTSQELAQQAFVNNSVAGGTVATQMHISEQDGGINISLNSPSLTEDNYHLELGLNTLTLYTSYGEGHTDDAGQPHRPTSARAFPIPSNVDRDEIEAVFEGNSLHIRLPFTNEKEVRRSIPIRTNYY